MSADKNNRVTRFDKMANTKSPKPDKDHILLDVYSCAVLYSAPLLKRR